MIREIVEQIIKDLDLIGDNVEAKLNYICSVIRKMEKINDPMDPECKVCYETSMEFGRIMYGALDYDVEILNIKDLLQIPLTHYANIISFDINGHKKTYLVDMTYSQFFGSSILLDNNERVSTEKVFGSIKDELFVQKLRQNGFVELTGDVLEQYIDAFLDICDVKNRSKAYYNIYELLANRRDDTKTRK